MSCHCDPDSLKTFRLKEPQKFKLFYEIFMNSLENKSDFIKRLNNDQYVHK